ncbi:MAG: polysaccharide export protein, partial [Hydrococcus sp. Prado102]|nr:polysaccharide export protein [Hydrococcus sp. Prado102]
QTPQSPTFRQEDLPPRTYTPPGYQERDSKVFRTYQLDVGDGISVIVQDFPEFSFSGVIGSDGNVLAPILGKVPLVGLTIQEVETKIAYELGRRFLREEPQVIASLASPRPVQLTLLGEVGRPGFYTLPSGTSIVSILLSAGGATPKADLRSIIVRRPLLDGTILEEKVDLYTPLLKGQKVPEVLLQGGDTVIVSRMEFGQEQGYDRGLIARTNLVQPTITVRLLAPNAAASGITLRNITVPTNSTFLDVVANLPSTDTLRVNFDEVALLRFDPEKGRVVSQELNPLGAVQGDLAQNVPLQDQDVIVVSRTLLGDILAIFRTVTQPVRDVFGFSNFILNIPDEFERLGTGGGGRGRGGFGF